MGQTIIAERNQTNVPIGVHVARDGGIVGLTVEFQIYSGADISLFLDFNDGIFKAGGHTTPTQNLTELGLGAYAVDGGFNLAGITVPPAADSLIVVYNISAGGESGNDADTIELVASILDIPAAVDTALSAAHGAGNWIENAATAALIAATAAASSRILAFAAQDNVMLDGGPGAVDPTVPDYDAAGLMLKGRMRAFDTAVNRAAATPGNVAVETGELYRQLISATAATPGQADSYTSDRDL